MDEQALAEAVLLATMGVACFGWVGWQRFRGWQSRRWPTTVARIRATSVEDFQSERALSESEALRLRYLYEVDGRMYSSTRIFFGDYAVPAPASYFFGRLAPGEAVTIRYNPRDPQESVIETGHPVLNRMLKYGFSLVTTAPFVYWAHVQTQSIDRVITVVAMSGLIGGAIVALRRRDRGPMDMPAA